MARKQKLHEILAVEQQLKGQAQATRTELQNTFDKKRHLFEEKAVVFTPEDEAGKEEREQQSSIQTTVRQELDWIRGIWSKAIDTSLLVQFGNTQGKADIVLEDGTVLLTDVPAAALLELEKRCAEAQELVKAVPTLDSAKGFQPDPDKGQGIYKARPVQKKRTAKLQMPIVLYDATDKHPAQTQLITKDVVVGRITEEEWSGLVTPAEKAEMITRAEALGRAVKQARMRANDVELADTPKFGNAMLGYVFTGRTR